jgi:epimerase transport system membrane fusion protein
MDVNNSSPAGLSVPALPVNDLPIRRISYAMLFVTFGLFGSWATFAPLDSAALAPGVVTVKRYRKTVLHLEDGTIKAIYVHGGDQVAAGDVLLELDGTQALAELERVRSQLIASVALGSRLVAERDGLDALDFQQDAATTDPRVLEAQQNEAQVFQARSSARLGETGVLQKRVVQLDEQIRGLHTVIAGKQKESAFYGDEVDDLSALLKEGFVDKQRLREQQRNGVRLLPEIAELRSSIAGARLPIGETELQIMQLNKDFIAEVVTQQSEVQTNIFDLNERFAAVAERAQRIRVRAPEAGMVLGMQVYTVGGVIAPGTPLLDLVPASEDLVVEAQIAPIDIDRIGLGKSADVRFSAFNSSTTPVIEGRLAQISADRLITEQTGVPY